MSAAVVRMTNAARDYCALAERMTVLRRNVAGDCPREIESVNHEKCHQTHVVAGDWLSDIIPEAEWCNRCRTFEAQKQEFRAVKRLRTSAERRMRAAWRATEAKVGE